jgi:ornithine carbamoyltransferase
MKPRHFLTLMDFTPAELRRLIRRATELKAMQRRGEIYEPLRNRILAMIFEKSSTRTRVSFEAGMTQLGGNCMFLSPRDTQLGRGEPLADTARVLSSMVDVIAVRTDRHDKIETFASNSRVPVINALTDRYHPCQLLADIQTVVERRGGVEGLTVAWVGDGNNVCHSWMNAARQFGFVLRLATPRGYEPDSELLAACRAHVSLGHDPAAAVHEADVVVTDTWASMGQEGEKAQRLRDFEGYRVDAALMRLARREALFMHCLPAYRGVEVDAEVLDGPQSAVWDEAENRLHAQKALLEFLLIEQSA